VNQWLNTPRRALTVLLSGLTITLLAFIFFFVLPYGDCLLQGGCEQSARQHYTSGVARYEAIQRTEHPTSGQLFRARTEFDMAIRAKPDFAEAYSYRALVHTLENSQEQAVSDCGIALRIARESTLVEANCRSVNNMLR
jgi:hypothetical protein